MVSLKKRWWSHHYCYHLVGWWQEGHRAIKPCATKHDLWHSLLSVGFARCLQCFFQSLFSAYGGGRCGVRSVRPVVDDAWRECCWSDRPTRASMETRTLNCMIDWLIDVTSCSIINSIIQKYGSVIELMIELEYNDSFVFRGQHWGQCR